MVGDKAQKLTVNLMDRRVIRSAKAGRACRDICKYAL
jgi:hypothetical protein